MNLPDAHTHPAPAASGTGLRFVCGTSPADWEQVALLAERDGNVTPFSAFIRGFLIRPHGAGTCAFWKNS